MPVCLLCVGCTASPSPLNTFSWPALSSHVPLCLSLLSLLPKLQTPRHYHVPLLWQLKPSLYACAFLVCLIMYCVTCLKDIRQLSQSCTPSFSQPSFTTLPLLSRARTQCLPHLHACHTPSCPCTDLYLPACLLFACYYYPAHALSCGWDVPTRDYVPLGTGMHYMQPCLRAAFTLMPVPPAMHVPPYPPPACLLPACLAAEPYLPI